MALMDIVDENDNVIGQREFDEVYASHKTNRPMLFRTIHVFVVTSDGKMVLQKRSQRLKVCPGMWDSSAAGHLDPGDSYKEAAIKELKEELGISVSQKEIVFLNKFLPKKGISFNFEALFLCRHDGPFTLNDEVDEIEILSIEDIIKRIEENPALYTRSFKRVFEFYLKWLDEEKSRKENNKKDLS